jgi:carbonic anhydrase
VTTSTAATRRPLEAIVAWNHRGTSSGEIMETGPCFDDAASSSFFPLIALTCIDPRLNFHFPRVLGLRPEQFIWLRNAGNVITSAASSTMRSLALACAVKGGREIAIIGHTDCGVQKTTVTELIEKFRALHVSRERLPDDLVTFFGMFASERQNVMRAVQFARESFLVGPRIPVHGLLIDVQSGRLEWIVNGYRALENAGSTAPAAMPAEAPACVAPPPLPEPVASPEKAHRSLPPPSYKTPKRTPKLGRPRE